MTILLDVVLSLWPHYNYKILPSNFSAKFVVIIFNVSLDHLKTFNIKRSVS